MSPTRRPLASDAGFGLLEVLGVMVIAGARVPSKAIEANYVDTEVYPSVAARAAMVASMGVTLSDSVALNSYTHAADGESFSVQLGHTKLTSKFLYYNSATGNIS